MFEKKKMNSSDPVLSQEDIMQSEQDMSFVHQKLKKLDAAIPESEHLSSEYLLRRTRAKKKIIPLKTVITAASAAAVVLVMGVAVAASGIGFHAKSSENDMAMDQEMVYSSSTAMKEELKEEPTVATPEENLKGDADNGAADADTEVEGAEGAQLAVYAAGSYSELLRVVESAAKDFAHIITTGNGEWDDANEMGIIGNIVVGMDVEFILKTDAEYKAVSELLLSEEKSHVVNSGNKRVYAISSDEMGALIGIDDMTSGELMSIIKMASVETIEQILLRDESLIIISKVNRDFYHEGSGTFDATVINVFNISDGYLPSKVERYASEGDLFTVLTDSTGVYVVVNRFAVEEMNMSTMEIEGMGYIPVVLSGRECYRIAPSNIYITGTIASMDYLIMFRVGDEEMRAYAYLGAADPLVAVNYLIEKFK